MLGNINNRWASSIQYKERPDCSVCKSAIPKSKKFVNFVSVFPTNQAHIPVFCLTVETL